MTASMRDRVRVALTHLPDRLIPPRFVAAYHAGGTPTAIHLVLIAEAAGTSPIWLMSGWPAEHAVTAVDRGEETQ